MNRYIHSFMKSEFELEYYFSEREIIKILCKKRALAAKKIHDSHFLRNISPGAMDPHRSSLKKIYDLFPPRKEWIRLNLQERNRRQTHSVEINAIQLERTIFRAKKRYRSKTHQPSWLVKLDSFVSDLKNSALNLSSGYYIPKPTIYPIPKDKKRLEFRPISSFELKDLIIISQYSKYLTNCFDQLFLDCSYAFRSNINSSIIFNHHKAVRDIMRFNASRGDSIFVAECDIKKFYDCVNHRVLMEKFKSLVSRAKKDLSLEVDFRAVNMFELYLNCFSFNRDVVEREEEILSTAGFRNGKIPWVPKEELLSVGSNPDLDEIGVPQGGALSCLIANIILDSVDYTIMNSGESNFFYARFCDDMVIMHADESKCHEMFKLYRKSLSEVKLVSHDPESLLSYNALFWTKKSKLPYPWRENKKHVSGTKTSVPWLSFVGYQVRYDNLIRIRKSSIEKELRKQVAETDKILRVIQKNQKVNINEKAVVFRLQQRLISMAVGRVQINSHSSAMCWSAGFNVIKKSNFIKAQFSKLDRNREHQIKRMTRAIASYQTPIVMAANPLKRLKHYGSKFSYHQQFL